MNKEQFLEYRAQVAASAKKFKNIERKRLTPSEFDEKYNIPKREKELSEARKRGKLAAGRGVLLEQNNILLNYMSGAAKKQAKLVDGVKNFVDINEEGKFVELEMYKIM